MGVPGPIERGGRTFLARRAVRFGLLIAIAALPTRYGGAQDLTPSDMPQAWMQNSFSPQASDMSRSDMPMASMDPASMPAAQMPWSDTPSADLPSSWSQNTFAPQPSEMQASDFQ